MANLERDPREHAPRSLNRRQILRFIAGGAGAAAFSMILAACGGSDDEPETSDTNAPTAMTSPATGSEKTTTPDASETPTSQAPAGNVQKNASLTIPIVTTIDVTLDPNKAQNWLLLGNLFPYVYEGLVMYDKDAHVQQVLAESYEHSDDGLTWTFHIKKEAKFASGRDIIADDFIYSWERSLDPQSPSPAAHFLEHLKGYEEFSKGQATTIEGVKAIDDKTLELTLGRPYNFFLSYMAIYPWYVVDRELVEKYGDKNNTDWTNHGAYGTGPWKVTKFDPTSGVELEPNENYHGTLSASITKLFFPILKGPVAANTGLNMYKGEQAQILPNFPISLLDAVEKDFKDEINWIDVGGTQSVAMSFSKEPFNNVLVRRAFAMAIDRDTLDDQVWRGTRKPTTCYIPSSVPDYTCPDGIEYNPDEAKKVLEAAGFANGNGLPPITLYISSETSAEDVNRWRALAEMWNKTLGSKVEIDTSMTLSQITDKRKAEEGFQMELMGWINITETPQLMSEVMRSDSPYMKGRFDWGIDVPAMTYNGETFDPTAASKKFDELVNQADVEQDAEKRNQMYHDAEALMLANAVYVPFGNYRFPALVKKNVKGLTWGAYFYNFPMPVTEDVSIESP